MEFTKEEIVTAEAVKKQMMEKDTPDTLKAIYMAGEICMYEEMKVKNLSSNTVLNADAKGYKEKYEKCIAVIKKFDAGIIGMYDL